MLRSLLIFALVAALGWSFREFWISPPETFFKQTPTTTGVPKADTYMLSTNTRQFNENGELAYRLTSDRSEHFTKKQRFILQNPQITSFQNDEPPWVLSAQHGLVKKNGESILFTGDVLGARFQEGRGEITLRTSSLLFLPEKQYAKSDKTVTINMTGATTAGVGLEANLKTGQYELLSKVKGTLDAIPQ